MHACAHTMYACMERVIDPSDICDGELIEEYLQLLMIFFQFININTNLKTKHTERVNIIVKNSFPQMKAIFKNLIEYSQAHPSCTNKMGTDRMSVVDEEAKVYGVHNLRVIDSSIMPDIVSGNLNAATLMIAEKASDLILGKKEDPLDVKFYS